MSSTPEASRTPRRSRLSGRKKLGFMAASVCLGLLLTEGTLRLFGYPAGLLRSTKKIWATEAERAEAGSVGPFRPDVEATFAWPPELRYTVRTNRLGLRGPLPAAGNPLVLCLGDSTTFGSHVPEEGTYPVLLETELARRGIEASVLNAGCPRWTITDQNAFLDSALTRLQPVVVVLLFCGNDLLELDKPPAAQRALEARGFLSDLRGRLAIPEAFLDLSLRAKRRYLQARGRWPQPLRDDQGRTGDWAQPRWARYRQELGWTRAMTQELGARLLVAAFPGFQELADERCEVEAHLPDIVRAAGGEYVDLYPPFRAAPEGRFLLPHDAHASVAGNALIAEAIAARLEASWSRE